MAEREGAETTASDWPVAYKFGPYRFDRANQVLSRNGSEVALPPRALKALGCLLERAGEVVSKDTLVDEVWSGTAVTDASCSEVVWVLRQALEDDHNNPKYIQTLHSRGFRFIAPLVEESPAPGHEQHRGGVPTDGRAQVDGVHGETTLSSGIEPASAASLARWKRGIRWGIGTVAAITVGVLLWESIRPGPPTVTKFVIVPPVTAPLANTGSIDLAISPDGRRIVYLANRGESTQLYLRRLDELDATPILGTEGASSFPFFSPDGRSVGFYAHGELKTVSLDGGAPNTICDRVSGWGGGGWTPQNTIVFAAVRPDEGAASLYRVSADGGEPEVLALPATEKGEVFSSCPKILPGGGAVLFDARIGQFGRPQIRALSLRTGQQKIVLDKAVNGYYLPTGHLVYRDYSRRNPSKALSAAPFDLRRLEVTGAAVRVLPGPRGVDFALSSEGTLVYVPGVGRQKTLVWVDRDGAERVATEVERDYSSFAISPDGQQVAASILDDGWNRNLWIYDLEKDWFRQLTFDDGQNVGPVWTPDGTWVIFTSDRDGPSDLYRMRVDGSGQAERLTTSELFRRAFSLSPDGRELLFFERTANGNGDIGILEMVADGKPRAFIASPSFEYSPSFSPDGEWFAYVRWRDGVYVSPYLHPEVKWLVARHGHQTFPRWSPDGTELFYRSGDKMMVVPIRTRPSFEAGKPRVLFGGYPIFNYDISPDGQRFLMMKDRRGRQGGADAEQIHVVVNWSQELEGRLSVDK